MRWQRPRTRRTRGCSANTSTHGKWRVFMEIKGEWISARLLIDTGADRTVLSASALSKLGFIPHQSEEGISGLGGVTDAVAIQTKLQLFRETGAPVTFHSHFTAVTDPTALDLSVLGRDILDLFALIVDRPGNTVCLLSQRHRYEIIQD